MFLVINYYSSLFLLVLSVVGVEIEVAPLSGICPDGTLEAPNHSCFKFISDRKTFFDAEDSCFSLGGHLALIDTVFTNTFVAENAEDFNTNDFWIGATVHSNYSSKPWVWTDSYKLLIYSNWGAGEPSGGETNPGQCAAVSVLDGMWKTANCSSTRPYVCNLPRVAYNCPSEWTYFSVTRSCYKVFFWANWQDAENVCINNGAHLASIHSQAENDFVAYLGHDGDSHGTDTAAKLTWIGLYTSTNDNSFYQWSDGSSFDYINWASHQPDLPESEKCGQFFYNFSDATQNNRFNNFICEIVMRNYVCKKKADVLRVI